MRLTLYSLLLAILAALPDDVAAQESVLVLGLATSDTDVAHAAEAARLTEVLRTEIDRTPGWSVDDATVSIRDAATAHGCAWYDPDEECVIAIAHTYGVRYVLYGRIQVNIAESNRFAVSLDLIDARDGSHAGGTYRTVMIDGDEAVLTLRVRELLEDINLRPAANGGSGTSGDRDLLVGSGVGLLVAGVASFAVTIASWVRISDIENDAGFHAYREMSPMGTNICTEAMNDPTAERIRSLCGDASLFEAMQVGFLLTALISAGAGGTLLGLGASQTEITVTPTVSRDGAMLALAARF